MICANNMLDCHSLRICNPVKAIPEIPVNSDEGISPNFQLRQACYSDFSSPPTFYGYYLVCTGYYNKDYNQQS